MSKNQDVIPFTELVERSRQIARAEAANDASRARGAVQTIYLQKFPAEEDWNFYLVQSALTATAPYSTGLATVNTQASTVTFSSDTVLDASFTGRKIKFSDNGDIYTLTFSNTTAATINPVLSGDQNITSGAFEIFSPIYSLASDFDRFPKNGGLQFWQGGRPKILKERAFQTYAANYSPTPSTPEACRLVASGTAGVQGVEITPPPDKAYNFPYEYLQRPAPLREHTGGGATIAAAGTTVTGSAGVSRFTEIGTGGYFRIDANGTGADSEWYRVIAVANDSQMTLQSAFGLSAAASANYTFCSAPQMPPKLHSAILYGSVMELTSDQNDPLFQLYQQRYTDAVNDGKRTYKTRIYGEEVETVLEDWQFRR